jgi:hypothetical protein
VNLLRPLLDHPLQKLLAVVVALGAWMYVQGQQVVEDRVRAQIMWRLPTGQTTLEPLPTTLTATVAGSRAALKRAAHATLKMQLDLRESEIGDHGVELSPVALEGVPAGVTVVDLSPSSVSFVLDEVTTRKMKVNPILVGDPAPGYVVDGVRIEPSVVDVSGPRLVIADQLDISTKPIDVSDIDGPREVPVELDLSWGVTYAGDDIVAKIRVDARDDSLNLTNRPVVVLDPAGGWAVSAAGVDVELQGPAAALSALDHTRISVLVYLPDEQTQSRYQVGLGTIGARMEVVNVPPEVRVVGVNPSVVEVFRR